MISRAELDELYRADDEVRAEHAEWLARREARARPFVRKSDHATPAAPVPFNEQQPDAAPFNEMQVDVLAHLVNLLRAEWEQEHAAELAELRGQVSTLLTLLGQDRQKSIPADVVELPNWRKKDAA